MYYDKNSDKNDSGKKRDKTPVNFPKKRRKTSFSAEYPLST
jgi:hypothetical protein